MKITFSGDLDSLAAADPGSYAVKIWGLKRLANYGSGHYNEHSLAVAGARLGEDRCTVEIDIPEIPPIWCMEIICRLKGADGQPFQAKIHNTSHELKPD